MALPDSIQDRLVTSCGPTLSVRGVLERQVQLAAV
jgi:hypothetical protein